MVQLSPLYVHSLSPFLVFLKLIVVTKRRTRKEAVARSYAFGWFLVPYYQTPAQSRNDVRIVGASDSFAREDDSTSKRYIMEDKEPCRRDDLRFNDGNRSGKRCRTRRCRRCYVLARSFLNVAFPARSYLSRSLRCFTERKGSESEKGSLSLSLRSLSLARSLTKLCLLVGSRGTTTGRVPEIIVRIDPRATRTGWIYSRARGERRSERKEGRRGIERSGRACFVT